MHGVTGQIRMSILHRRGTRSDQRIPEVLVAGKLLASQGEIDKSGGSCGRDLAEDAKQICNEKDKQHGSESDACSATGAPTTVAVVTASTAEQQNQNNDEYQHLRNSPFAC